jgi:ApaG protein
MTQTFQATTSGITVTVQAAYLVDQSNPAAEHFSWAYHITITNAGKTTVQLLRRTWLITDDTGYTRRVQGDGVVGKQPVLAPGESFSYTSGASLPTASGFMTGQYHMETVPSGEPFDIAIPAFSLDSPQPPTRLH